MGRVVVLFSFGLVAALVTVCSGQSPDYPQAVEIEVAFPNLEFERPLYVAQPPGETERLYVLEQRGRVVSFADRRDVGQNQVREVLDIRSKVRREHNEEGLLGLAFHPDYQDNREVYLHYSSSNPRRNVVSRFIMQDNGRLAPQSEEVLLELEQPYGNHDGGQAIFGPDGYLYLTFGDGGSGGDPEEAGQDLRTLLGTILRIDVDGDADGRAYAIPEDNPFVDVAGARDEIYAFGLRNVWRMSFDAKTGELWAGDVGQNEWEEIDRVVKGGNYGWDIREGRHSFEEEEAPRTELIDPVHEYPREAGVSVTGGYVYRGEEIEALNGVYVFADYGSGRIWGFRHRDGRAVDHARIGQVPSPASFGEDNGRTVYITSFDGQIYRLAPASR
jgi:glucose/arabinose dehydrogenase